MRKGKATSTGAAETIVAEANRRAVIEGRTSGGMTWDTLRIVVDQ